MAEQHLADYTIAVLGAGAVGRSVAADCKLAGESLKDLDKTGIEIQGFELGKYNFKRNGIAKFDLVSDDLAEVVAGAQIILVAVPSVGHQTFFERLVPLLEDGQIIHIIPDNFGSLRLRKVLRETRPDVDVIVGGWSSAPYGTRIVKETGIDTKRVFLRYRAVSLRGRLCRPPIRRPF